MTGAAAWADALQSLGLFSIDPIGLGGLSIRAAAGPVRDHFLKLLHQSLPPERPVRRLPLHVGDDRLLGGLDLAATLQAGRPVAQKGLLAEADGGVVLLAMAERIDAATQARLRAALDTGAITLQRDGLARILPTRFAIVALDEGVEPDERTPASLLDRMAFHIDLNEVSLRDIAGSVATLPVPASLDPISLETASVETAPAAAEALCHAALALGIDSLRAPLLALRAARAAAIRSGNDQITDDDLGSAARLVLTPRATRFPAPQQADTEEQPEPIPEPPAEKQDPTTQDPATDPQTLPDQPLSDVVLDAVKAALPVDLLAALVANDAPRAPARAPGRAGQVRSSTTRGRPIGTRPGEPRNGARLHLLETLKAAAPWQVLRRRSGRFEVRKDDFRIIRFRQRIGATTVFAVDASGSAAMHRLAEAKGAVELLLADCYVRRDQVALIAFRGNAAKLLLPPTGSLLRAKRSLAGLPGGGPTPLAAGIEAATTLADTVRRAGRTPVITLLTDAHANIARDGTGGRPRAEAEAIEAARALRMSGVAALLIDTSPRPNPFARRIATEMAAHYLPLPYADAGALSRAVRAAAAA
ncbi:magnesium chelatase subunit D [Rhodopila sp.]|uniref:magnesium chelatase subunit D n=1 Tax=Rhodopila sp. TaxID=2480087 RepID=UPI003D0A16F5